VTLLQPLPTASFHIPHTTPISMHYRVDTIIQLPLPNAEERLAFTVQSCAEFLAEFMDSDERDSLQGMLSSSISEMTPSSRCGQEPLLHSISCTGACEASPPTPCPDAHHLNLESCISELILRSDTWSLRDIARIFTSLRYELQCTER
jgi:hypothetical protein